MNEVSLPKKILQLLRSFCPSHLLEEIEGDLLQKFEKDVKLFEEGKAKRRLLWNTIRYFRPGILLRNKFSKPIHMMMLGNYMKISWRVIGRNRFNSAINVSGLTIGISFALLIGIFIRGELEVNQSLKDVDRLYFVENRHQNGAVDWPPGALTKEAVIQYPTLFESYYRFVDRGVTVSKEDKHFRLGSMICDSTFFKMFGFKSIYGDLKTALTNPNSVVVTEKIANQFFNRTDIIGETISVSTERFGKKEFAVTAVISNPQAKNSVTDFMNQNAEVFFPMEVINDFFSDFDVNSWQIGVISYVKLKPSVSAKEAMDVLNSMFKKNQPTKATESRSISLNPLESYYRTTDNKAVEKLISSLAVIAIFILFLAVVNFVNISIASSFSRLREIGVRKVLGGLKSQVMTQFLLEAILLSLLSGVLAILVYQLSSPYFSDMLGRPLVSIFGLPKIYWIIIGLTVLSVGLLAGLYPSIYLSLTKPVDSLKGKFRSVQGTIRFSRTLIAAQFTVTIFIFIAAIVLSQQVSYFLNTDLGYNKSQILIVNSVPRVYSPEGFNKAEAAKQEFVKLSCIKSATLSWGSPSMNLSPVSARIYLKGKTIDDGVKTDLTSSDQDYLKVYGIQLVEGRFILGEGKNYRQNELVINEMARNAIEAKVGDIVKSPIFGDQEFTIVGVMKDFNYESLREKVSPLALMHNRDFSVYRYFSFELQGKDLVESVQQIEKKWKEVFQNEPFSYSFADEQLTHLYATELQLKKGSVTATALMTIIVLTGILGLVSLSISKRGKEIGIRKVLGATIFNILLLISREYIWLLATAFILGTSLAYWFSINWLQTYSYHIKLSWWMFVLPFLIVFLLTILVICAHSVKTALINPVKSLRAE